MLYLLCIALALAVNGHSWDKEFDLVDFSRLDFKEAFGEWKIHFNKEYSSVDEEFKRFGIFIDNLRRISQWNSGDETSTVRPNQFSDWTDDEFKDYVARGYKGMPRNTPILNAIKSKLAETVDKLKADPTSVDWTTQGVVTPVKNQGNCGSCWAFSATGSTECQYAIAHGTLNSLSEQQLVDCSGSYGNDGCNGGLMDSAFKYIENEGGLCSESEYPYTAKDGTCKATSCGTKYDTISSYTDVTPRSEPSLESAVAAGCVSVAIQANQFAFQYYSGGVLTGNCGTNLDHGVLAVGYGYDSTSQLDYWLVKNSWGTSWGENGYIRICKSCDKNGNQGECGILDEPSYPNA
jgi:cathepsin L